MRSAIAEPLCATARPPAMLHYVPQHYLARRVLRGAGFFRAVFRTGLFGPPGIDRDDRPPWNQSPTLAVRFAAGGNVTAAGDASADLFGGPVLRYAVAIPAAIILYRIGYPLTALWFVSALGSGWIVDGIVKHVFKRKRPTIVPHLAPAGGPSFPSGHTLNASLVYCALAIAWAAAIGPAAFALALSGALLLSAAVGFSRVWLGVHWPTDVTAGWLLGTGWWLASYAVGETLLGQ